MSLKTLSKIITILTISFSVSAFATNNIELAKRAHQLSVNLTKTIDLEQNSFCQYELDEASEVADASGKYYMNNDIDMAKQMMKHASATLAYTSVETCSQATSIATYKKEADSILSDS